MLHEHNLIIKKKYIEKQLLGFLINSALHSHSKSVCFFSALLLQVPVGEYSSCSQISRIKPYHATTIPLPDVLLSCKKLPRCWKRGGREREMWKWEKRGGEGEGVAQGADDVVVVHSKTLLLFSLSLSIKSTENRTRRKMAPSGRGGKRGMEQECGVCLILGRPDFSCFFLTFLIQFRLFFLAFLPSFCTRKPIAKSTSA